MTRTERRADQKADTRTPVPAAPPLGAQVPPPLAAQVFVEAVRHHQAGRTSEAETLYRAILILNPRHAEASYNLGVLLQTRGNPLEAAIAYRHTIALRPDFVGAYSNLGTALQDTGRLDEAI